VNEVIQEMIVLLRSEASRYSISIRGELANDLPNIMVDRVQLQQVFMNLMLNGIEAMKDMGTGGELTIKSQQDDNRQLLISVGDTGVGLEPEQAEQIFNAFFTTKPQGTGMGLPISRSIIESHGGRLWATSNSGPGATFQFTLPSEVTARQAAYPSDCTPKNIIRRASRSNFFRPVFMVPPAENILGSGCSYEPLWRGRTAIQLSDSNRPTKPIRTDNARTRTIGPCAKVLYRWRMISST